MGKTKFKDKLIEILEELFPKRKCKERGQAMVLVAHACLLFKKYQKRTIAEERVKMAKVLRMKKEKLQENPYHKIAGLFDRGKNIKFVYKGYNQAIAEINKKIKTYLKENEG